MAPLRWPGAQQRDAAERRSPDTRDSMDPGFWGIEKHSARRILKDLACAKKPRPRPRPLPVPEQEREWGAAPKAPGGLIDPSLRTSSMAAHEAREDLKARWGLQYDPGEFAATSLRPVVPAGALTPAAQRMLAPNRHPRSQSTPPGQIHSTGGMLGMIQMRRTMETLPQSSWRAVFTDTKRFSPGNSFENMRQDHRTGLCVRAGRATSRLLTASRSLDMLPSMHSNSLDDHGDELASKMLAEAGEFSAAEFEAKVTELTTACRFAEAVGALTDLRTVRKFVSKAMGGTGVLSLLGLMNRTCQPLEDAARRTSSNTGIQRVASEEGKTENLFYWLESLRQHRKFVLEEYEAFQRRPQSVLERALLLHTKVPIVCKNARRVVQQAEKETSQLMSKLNEVLSTPTASTRSAVDLAFLKAKVRDICLDGSMQTSQSEPVAAAQFRVLLVEVAKRTIQVRKVMLDTGIPVPEKVLHELLRRDESLFPFTAFDYSLAQQAVNEAKSALEDLQGSIQRDQELERTARKEQKAAEQKRRVEENEIKKIEENEEQLEMNEKLLQTKHARAMEPAIVHPVWGGPCGGSSSGRLGQGGCVVMHNSWIYATSDNNDIWVYDLNTTMFDFCKTYYLRGGHTQTVLSLTILDGHTLFSGSRDKTVCVWDVERDFALTQVLEGHTDVVTCLSIAHCTPGAAEAGGRISGKLLCSGSFDTTIRIWQGFEVPFDEELTAVGRIKSERSKLGEADCTSHGAPGPGTDGRVKTEWRCVRFLFGHGCFIHSIVTDGKFAYSAGEDGLIKVWDTTLKHSIGQLEGCSDSIYALFLRKEAADKTSSKATNHLLTSGLDYRINIWDLQQATFWQPGSGQRVLGDISDSLAFSFTPDSVVDDARNELAKMERNIQTAVTKEGKLLLEQGVAKFNVKVEELLKWQSNLQFVKSLAACNDFLYSAGAEDVMRIWSLSMSTCVGTVKGFKGINSMSLNSQEEILAVCTYDSRVLVMGAQETAMTKAKEKRDRESAFSKEGGELWTVDLVNDSARLLLPRVRIGQVSCGQKHGIALDSQGGAWSWGASNFGQCGLGTKDDVALPRRIDFFEGNVSTKSVKIKAVSAGWYHSVLLLDTGTAHACGENNIGQLGLPESEESKILYREREIEFKKYNALPPGHDKDNCWRKIQQIDSAHSVANLVYTFRHVILSASQKQGLTVSAVAAGGRHSIFIDDSGAAWACGLATEGQQMVNLESVTVVAARASMSHSLLMTNMGKNLGRGLPEETCLQHAHSASAVEEFKTCYGERIS